MFARALRDSLKTAGFEAEVASRPGRRTPLGAGPCMRGRRVHVGGGLAWKAKDVSHCRVSCFMCHVLCVRQVLSGRARACVLDSQLVLGVVRRVLCV